MLSKVRDWAARVPEIHVDDQGRNPVIRVQLSDVDYESVVETRQGRGQRRAAAESWSSDLVPRRSACDPGSPDMLGAYPHTVVWRGSRREVDIVFGNVRDAGGCPTITSARRRGTWRFVIDHPFDEPGHSCGEDVARLDGCWPAASQAAPWCGCPGSSPRSGCATCAGSSSSTGCSSGTGTGGHQLRRPPLRDRPGAGRAILEAPAPDAAGDPAAGHPGAYGVESPRAPDDVVGDASHDRVLLSLDAQLHAASTRRRHDCGGIRGLVPRPSPRRTRRTRGSSRRTRRSASASCWRSTATSSGHWPTRRTACRWSPDAPAVRRIANPLGVGKAAETHFLFGDDRFGPWGAGVRTRGSAAPGLGRHDPVTVQAGARVDRRHATRPRARATRSRTWSSSPGRRCASGPGTPRVPRSSRRSRGQSATEMELRDAGAAGPRGRGTLAESGSRGGLFGVPARAYLTAGRRWPGSPQPSTSRPPPTSNPPSASWRPLERRLRAGSSASGGAGPRLRTARAAADAAATVAGPARTCRWSSRAGRGPTSASAQGAGSLGQRRARSSADCGCATGRRFDG